MASATMRTVGVQLTGTAGETVMPVYPRLRFLGELRAVAQGPDLPPRKQPV